MAAAFELAGRRAERLFGEVLALGRRNRDERRLARLYMMLRNALLSRSRCPREEKYPAGL
jgi:hypothetical protein